MPDKKENNEDKVNSGKDVNKKTDSSSHKDKPKTGSKENISQKDSKPIKKEVQKDKKVDESKKGSSDSPKEMKSKQENKDAKNVSKDSSAMDSPKDKEKKSSDETDNKKDIGKKVEKANPDSNYQVSLVDENTLKIKIKTDKGVSLNSTVGGKNVLPDDVENLLNRLGSGKDGEIEIEISINPDKKISSTGDEEKPKDEKTDDTEKNVSGVLVPNPDVANIINKKVPLEEEIQLTDEEILREKIGRKSPYNIYRRIYAQNFQIGLIAGVVIYLIAIFSFYSVASKDRVLDDEPQQRLIVLQDLPDPKIKLENIEDPNAPVKEDETEEDGTVPKRIPIKRNFNRPPTVKRPQNENKDTTTLKDTTGLADTNTVSDTSTASGNPIPDSLMASYSGNEIGLIMNYPNNWKLVDSRTIDVKRENFEGVILSDTTVSKGTFNMFVKIDTEGKPFDRDRYKSPFEMNDSTMSSFSADPEEQAGKIEYHFYIFGGKNNLKAYGVVDVDKFPEYKPQIEAVIRSISFAPDPPQ